MPEFLVPSRAHSKSLGRKCWYPMQHVRIMASSIAGWRGRCRCWALSGRAQPVPRCSVWRWWSVKASPFPPVLTSAFCPQGSQKELLNLTQQDYVSRIEELNQSLKDAWASDQKVKALKIVIQVRLFEGLRFSISQISSVKFHFILVCRVFLQGPSLLYSQMSFEKPRL